MSAIETLGKTELLEAVGDVAAKKASDAIHVPGETATVSIDANPRDLSISVEFTPKLSEADAPDIDFTPNPTEKLP